MNEDQKIPRSKRGQWLKDAMESVKTAAGVVVRKLEGRPLSVDLGQLFSRVDQTRRGDRVNLVGWLRGRTPPHGVAAEGATVEEAWVELLKNAQQVLQKPDPTKNEGFLKDVDPMRKGIEDAKKH